jgi:hypothetical protein
MVSELFKNEVFWYQARGGGLWRLAIDNGMTPSMLRATLTGARHVDRDERIVKIGAQLGLSPDECFTELGGVAVTGTEFRGPVTPLRAVALTPKEITSHDWSVLGRVLVSLMVLIVAVYVILNNGYPDATTKWAFGAVGLILGYWLK